MADVSFKVIWNGSSPGLWRGEVEPGSKVEVRDFCANDLDVDHPYGGSPQLVPKNGVRALTVSTPSGSKDTLTVSRSPSGGSSQTFEVVVGSNGDPKNVTDLGFNFREGASGKIVVAVSKTAYREKVADPVKVEIVNGGKTTVHFVALSNGTFARPSFPVLGGQTTTVDVGKPLIGDISIAVTGWDDADGLSVMESGGTGQGDLTLIP